MERSRASVILAVVLVTLAIIIYFVLLPRSYAPVYFPPTSTTVLQDGVRSVAVVPTGWDARLGRLEMVDRSNCDGESAVEIAYITKSTVDDEVAVLLDTTALQNAGIQVDSATTTYILQVVASTAPGVEGRVSDVASFGANGVTLVVDPGLQTLFRLREVELWQLGYVTAETDSGKTVDIPFSILVGVSYYVEDRLEKGCALAGTPGTAATVTRQPAATVIPTPPPWVEPYEDELQESGDEHRVGELEVEYPVQMAVSSSDVVAVSLRVADLLYKAHFVGLERADSPSSMPFGTGVLSEYIATIPVRDQMRLELQSPTFEIEALYPSSQAVALSNDGRETNWAWTIVAPDVLGSHTFTLRAYLGNQSVPAWTGVFTVDVTAADSGSNEGLATPTGPGAAPVPTTRTPVPTSTPDATATPAPTATATPAPEAEWNMTDIVVALFSFAGVALTAFVTYIVAKKFGPNQPRSGGSGSATKNRKPKNKV